MLYLDGIPTIAGAVNLDANSNVADDVTLGFGGGSPVGILWETADSDANALLISLPTGGAIDVPVIAIGQGISNVNLGLYTSVVNPLIAVFGVGAVTTAPIWEFRKARGTIAAPTAITTGDDLGSINAYACVANGEWVQSAAIEFDSSGTIATTRGPGAIRLRTATDAAPSVLTTRLTIANDGQATFSGAVVVGSNLYITGNGNFMQTGNADNYYYYVATRDNSVGVVEIMRFAGAADPYIRIGRDDTGVATNAVTDMLVLQAGAGTNNEANNFGLGIAFNVGNAASEVEKRASVNLVLTDATNGNEDVELNVNLMIAGAGAAEVASFVGGGLDLPTGKVLSVAGTQVVGARVVDARCDDTINSGDGTTDGVIDALRDAMIAHGLIAAA